MISCCTHDPIIGTGPMVCPRARLPQSQWSDSEGYGQNLSVPKHNVSSPEHVRVYACLYEWAVCYLDMFVRKKKTGRFDSVKLTGRDFGAIGAQTWFL